MNPLPEHARPSDPHFEIAFLALAHGLIEEGARAKIIARFTELPVSKIRRMYRVLAGRVAPSGPILQAHARAFVMLTKHTSAAWSVQCAMLLTCYERIGKLSAEPLHRGWRLLNAYRAYRTLTEAFCNASGVKQLDINQAYALLTHCGFLEDARHAALTRVRCPQCLIRYPVLVGESRREQRCPVCSVNANTLRLNSPVD